MTTLRPGQRLVIEPVEPPLPRDAVLDTINQRRGLFHWRWAFNGDYCTYRESRRPGDVLECEIDHGGVTGYNHIAGVEQDADSIELVSRTIQRVEAKRGLSFTEADMRAAGIENPETPFGSHKWFWLYWLEDER